MDELFDIYLEDGTKTGIQKERSKVHTDGDLHASVHIWIIQDGKILLQKRRMDKDSFPGCLDAASTGHVDAGEDFLTAAVREVKEELGLTILPQTLRPVFRQKLCVSATVHGHPFVSNEINQVYLYTGLVQDAQLSFQKSEIETLVWIEPDTLRRALLARDRSYCISVDEFEKVMQAASVPDSAGTHESADVPDSAGTHETTDTPCLAGTHESVSVHDSTDAQHTATGIFKDVMQFRGTFRDYQKRVLTRSSGYLADKRLHIVAAPGSGKTTLGIELISRLGSPCLILTPSITIREQWDSRIVSSFLKEGESADKWISSSIRSPRPITILTYQALHSAYTRFHGTLPESDMESDAETVDYSDFDLLQTVRDAGIRTICLDEAHHLRSEWWKVLEQFLSALPDVTLICLTATPPYDSTPQEWKRYTNLCGPIDEEISTPELVKAGNLCPHQDYIYFNVPTADEKKALGDFRLKSRQVYETLSKDREFVDMIKRHKGIAAQQEYTEFFLDRPDYFSSILIFLHENHVPLSSYLKSLLGTEKNLPPLSPKWLETLLQGFLYDDNESYENAEPLRERLLALLKENSCISKRRVTLTENDALQNMLLASKGKLNSILTITKSESESLGSSLRELILCDYIKKEYLSYIGHPEKEILDHGVIPIFERLRRENIAGLKLGVLCGTVIIIPDSAVGALEYQFVEHNTQGRFTPLGDTGYQQVTISGKKSLIVNMITSLFEAGEMQVLIGTKSLLGEGWDSPCINTLILASFVGSFMLSNQMRGRAIRVCATDPGKISNIWHLVCVDEEETSTDYEMMKRRFASFLGVSYSGDVIENGLTRLSLPQDGLTKEKTDLINREMLSRSKDRAALKSAWDKALMQCDKKFEVEDVAEVPKCVSAPGFLMVSSVLACALSLFFTLLTFLIGILLKRAGVPLFGQICVIAGWILAIRCLGLFGKLMQLCSPKKRMARIGKSLLCAMREAGLILSRDARVQTCVTANGATSTSLLGGTSREKSEFAKAFGELFSEIDNPRYLLLAKKKMPLSVFSCLNVPECLGIKKETAALLQKRLQRFLCAYELVYTRTPQGRKILLKERTRNLTGARGHISSEKKRVHGKS